MLSTAITATMTRLGIVMTPQEGDPLEQDGVLNPASGRDADGRLWLLPRMVARGNVSRVGLAEVLVKDGQPTGVRREGVVLAPDAGWERAIGHAGVEDPRATWIPSLGVHAMTYIAFGPIGPRPALATSTDLRTWTRRGPIHFDYQPDLDTDLNLFPNKDCVFFPEPVTAPDGRAAYAMLHRPMWDLSWVRPGEGTYLPAGITDDRPGIWISYIPVDDVADDPAALTHQQQHRLVAQPEYDFEQVKIGAGPPPLRVDGGWLLIHHGVTGKLAPGFGLQPDVRYSAGAMLLDLADPSQVLARTPEPLLEPAVAAEIEGIVANVVFPTAIEEIEGTHFVFYGMADSAIGVARLDW
jgi:beta-1,2-mannobiose phosphorylase / 1,2-beta-oligomannan phosphorylase